jgi:rubredoxin
MKTTKETKFGLNIETVNCPECSAKMPKIRVPENLHQLMWGGWTCPECGCKMDKWGKPLDS